MRIALAWFLTLNLAIPTVSLAGTPESEVPQRGLARERVGEPASAPAAKSAKSKKEKPAVELYELGLKHMQHGYYTKALEEFQSVLEAKTGSLRPRDGIT